MEKEYLLYEYITVKIRRVLSDTCQECYQCFGWEILSEKIAPEGKELQMRRSRKIKNRTDLMAQQRKMEDAMITIERYENVKDLMPTIAAILVGLIGTVFFVLAGMAATRGLWAGFVILLVPGFALCTLPLYVHKVLLQKNQHMYEEEINREYGIIAEACEQAKNLLA